MGEKDVAEFIERWRRSGGAERANYALFLTELCDDGLAMALTRDQDYLSTGIVTAGAGGVIQDLHLAYDDGGNIVAIEDATDAESEFHLRRH